MNKSQWVLTDVPVTAVVTRTPKRDKVAEFEEWLQGFIRESFQF